MFPPLLLLLVTSDTNDDFDGRIIYVFLLFLVLTNENEKMCLLLFLLGFIGLASASLTERNWNVPVFGNTLETVWFSDENNCNLFLMERLWLPGKNCSFCANHYLLKAFSVYEMYLGPLNNHMHFIAPFHRIISQTSLFHPLTCGCSMQCIAMSFTVKTDFDKILGKIHK